MTKKVVSLLLALVLTVGLLPALPVSAEVTYTSSQEAIDLLKQMEGFAKYPYFDYSQYTVGYGTRCPDEDYARYATNGITEEEAEALLRQYLKKEEEVLSKFAADKGLTWTQNQFDAIMLFSYNCGTSWLYQTGDFHNAVVQGKTGEDFLYAIALWCNAGGSILPGLVKRRLIEANMYLNGEYASTPPANYCYVTYNPVGGTVSSRIEAYDSTVSHAPTVFTMRSGFTFDGWYTAKNGGEKVETLTTSVSGMTLYARWLDSEGNVADTSEPTTPPSTPTEPPATDPVTPPSDEFSPVTVTVLDTLNVRSGAGTGNSIVGSLDYGTRVEVTAVQASGGYTWGKISQGWICLYYTNYDRVIAGESDDTPVAAVTGKVIDTNNLRIRSGPGLDYSILGYLSLNTPVTITEQRSVSGMTWGKISQGWISMDYVALDSETAAPEAPAVQIGTVVNSSYLQIRSGPGFAYGVVGTLDGGDRVEITEQKYADGMTWGKISQGWISMDYIALESDTPSDPPADPTEPSAPTTPPSGSVYGTVINSSFLRIREDAGLSYSVVGYLYSGNRVEITDTKDADGMTWGKISQGWISMDYIALDSSEGSSGSGTENIQGEVVNCEQLRVRNGAGTDYSIAGYLQQGEVVTITATTMVGSTKWGYIGWGWISMDYIREHSGETPSTPETPSQPDTPAQPEAPAESTGTMTGTIVDTSELRVRSGAGFSYSVLGYIAGGTTVEISEYKTVDGMIWGKISQGWISLDYVALDSNTTPNGTKICVVNTDYLNVRTGGGTQHAAVSYYVRGERVEILEEKDVNGTTWGRTPKGWICMDYVK